MYARVFVSDQHIMNTGALTDHCKDCAQKHDRRINLHMYISTDLHGVLESAQLDVDVLTLTFASLTFMAFTHTIEIPN